MHDMNTRLFLKHEKQLFDQALLVELRDKMDRLRAMQENQSNQTPREQEAIRRGESSDKTRMQSDWYKVWQANDSHSRLIQAIMPYRYVTFPVQVRHVKEVKHHVPWHQDIGYMRLLGDKAPKQVMTCFIPLEPNPSRCTTIQFALDNMREPNEREYVHQSLNAFGAGIEQSDFHELQHFPLSLGDALIFGDHVLHRTYLPEGCQPERRSLEFRLVKPEHVLPGKDYFDVLTGKFVKFSDTLVPAASGMEAILEE